MTGARTTPALSAGAVELRPTVAADAGALRAIHEDPAVSRWWDLPDDGFPMTDEPDAVRLTIRCDGEIAGLVQFYEETEPKYRHAEIDIFVGPAHQGRGVGTATLRLLVDHLLRERGHHRIQIDPAADNAAAVACYRKAGFTPVGVMRLAERDSDGRGWHDALLMELVVDPVTSP